MWAVLAGLISVLAGLVELVAAGKKPPPLRAWHWVLLRMSMDAVVGYGAYPLVDAAIGDGDGQVFVSLIAGLAGAAVLRMALVIDRGAGKATSVGLEKPYRAFLRWVNDRIDKLGAAAQAGWVNDFVLPTLASMPLEDLGDRAETYYRARDRMSARRQALHLEFVRETIADPLLPEPEKKRRLVNYLIDSGDGVFVQALVRIRRS